MAANTPVNVSRQLFTAIYTATWQNVPEGQYSLTAKAIDNGGGEAYSSAMSITVGPAGLQVYYLHSDHLNTPRVATDEQNRIVWRNSALAELFGTRNNDCALSR